MAIEPAIIPATPATKISSGEVAGAATTDDQAGGGNNPVIGAENGGAPPANAFDKVVFKIGTRHEFRPFIGACHNACEKIEPEDDIYAVAR
jgi:hypothetical protein